MNPVGLIYFVLIVIALILALTCLRSFFKRLRCRFSIRRLCRKHGLIFRAGHPAWFLGSRYLRGCDFTLEAADTLFAVKFFGCFWPLKALIFRERGEYFFRARSAFLAPLLDVFDGYPHALPEYRFPGAEGKEVRRILLVNPMPIEIRFQPSSGLESVSGTGDMLRGMEIASLSHLIRIAENAAALRG